MAKKRKGKGKMTETMGTPAYDIAGDEKWRAQDDLRTIERAHEVVHDTKRFSAAKAEAKRQKESLDRIARLEGKRL